MKDTIKYTIIEWTIFIVVAGIVGLACRQIGTPYWAVVVVAFVFCSITRRFVSIVKRSKES